MDYLKNHICRRGNSCSFSFPQGIAPTVRV
ncbi:hypothetical protein F8S12_19625 [Nostoc sp. WHI]|nr:hypothetical protein [Nostoc sp. WHI]